VINILQKQLIKILVLYSVFGLGLLTIPSFASSNRVQISSFEFTLSDGTIHSISEYTDKGQTPILLEWGASWCTACDVNLRAMSELYPSFKNDINFLSLSFGGSGDTLENLNSLNSGYYSQNNIEWPLGLDHTNKARDLGVANGFFTFLTPSLEIFKTYQYVAIVSAGQKNQLRQDLNALLQGETLNDQDSKDSLQSPAAGGFPFELVVILAVVGIAGFGFYYSKQRNKLSKNAQIRLSQSSSRQKKNLTALKSELETVNDDNRLNRRPVKRKKGGHRR